MKKYIKYLIIIVIFIILFLLINHFMKPDIDIEIENTLIEKGFQKTEYENLYEKNETNSKKLSFSTADYTFMLNVDDVSSNILSSLSATYYFNNNSIDYSYRVNNINLYNALFKGSYDGENFTCEKEFSNVSIKSSDKDNMCKLAETNIKLFYLEAKTLFSNYKLIEYMKQQ